MLLWNHDRVSVGRAVPVGNPDGSTRHACPVTYDGEPVGWVARAEQSTDGWAYLLAGDVGRPWTIGGGWSRTYAVDHLLSAWSPSAPWLD